MDFTANRGPGELVVWLRGSFTFKDHHAFRAVLDLLGSDADGRRVLDLSLVEFLDSAALGMLLIAQDEVTAAHGMLVLRHPAPQIARLLDLAAMDTLFRIEHARETAP